MKELDRRLIDLPDGAENGVIYQHRKEEKCVLNAITVMGILLAVFTIFSFMFSMSVIHYGVSFPGFHSGEQQPDFALDFEPLAILESGDLPEETVEKLFGGLLSPGFDNKSCISRYRSGLYRNPPTCYPSSYLIYKIRSYESLHKRCGPHTEPYRKALDKLSSGKQSGLSDCNYLVWISYGALENRILALTSAFLYALITDRVLLVDRGKDIADLFCEPFPETSWLLPTDFPLTSQFDQFNQKSNHSYGSMLKRHGFINISDNPIPSSLYVHLGNGYDDQDKLFFCDQDQSFFKKVPWLIMKTDNYFIPSLLLIPSFEQELSYLFPKKETVFHFLGRFLFHPTNEIWDLITRYHEAFMSTAYERIGIQIRVFDTGVVLKEQVLDQILSCVSKEGILPGITKQKYNTDTYQTKSVIVTSLDSWYFEQLKDMYQESLTTTGEAISFFQPIHVEYQQTDDLMQNINAWAEMYLLSLTDKLVTSSWSTFGYVAQGLGGLRPWILFEPENQKVPSPPCQRAMSMEQCYHAPPFDICKRKAGADTGLLVPREAL